MENYCTLPNSSIENKNRISVPDTRANDTAIIQICEFIANVVGKGHRYRVLK
jgi:hypothetical protein